MNFKILKTTFFAIMYLGLVNSCSTGTNPEDIIIEDFELPAQITLQIQNIINDMAMEVNGIAMNNLDETKTKEITKDVEGCLTVMVHANTDETAIDSIVMDYGDKSCSSNGANFKGKMIIELQEGTTKIFDVWLKDFISSGYTISGNIVLEVKGNSPGKDFLWTMSNTKFEVTDQDGNKSAVTINSVSSEYKYIKSQEDDKDYVDDVFEFTINLDGTMPTGAAFSFESTTGLTYAYKCKDILGGDAIFTLEGFGDGYYDFGDGDPLEDCDKKVIFNAAGATVEMTL